MTRLLVVGLVCLLLSLGSFATIAQPSLSYNADRHGNCSIYEVGNWRIHEGHWDRCYVEGPWQQGWYQAF